MGNLFGKEETSKTDETADFRLENAGYDEVRYDGPLDLNQIIIMHSRQRGHPSTERKKLAQKPGQCDDTVVSSQGETSEEIYGLNDTTCVLQRTAEPSISTEDEAILPEETKLSQNFEASDAHPINESQASRTINGGSYSREQSLQMSESLKEEQNVKPLSWEIDVTDLAAPKEWKRKKSVKGVAKKVQKKDVPSIPSPREDKYIPPTVTVTTAMLAERKVLDQRRWFCMSRPQYSKSCGLSSLVSCWNFLFSTFGGGDRPPITQEEALTVLGFEPPFGDIRFGPFTGNGTLMRWFRRLNTRYGTRGKAYHMYKPVGKARTVGRTSEEALRLLKAGLRDSATTFIYHCWNHYFCPVGFEEIPKKAVDAFRGPLSEDEVDTWILVADPSRKQPGIHCFRWEDISTDLNCKSPECLNIRKLHLGVQTRKTKRVGGNLHCLMAFKRSDSQSASATLGQRDGRLGQKKRRMGGWVSRLQGLDEGLQTGVCEEPHEVPVRSGFDEVEAAHLELSDEVGVRFKTNDDGALWEMQVGGSEATNEELRIDDLRKGGEVSEAVLPEACDMQSGGLVVRITQSADKANERFHLKERTEDDSSDGSEEEHTDSSEE